MRWIVVALVCMHPARAWSAVVLPPKPTAIRVATFNLYDVRTSDLLDGEQPRLQRLAEIIQRVRPNVILLNEIAWDGPGGPGFVDGDEPGQNARRFVEKYLAVPQAPGLKPLRMHAFMAKVNTGMHSGFDLDHDGRVVDAYPAAESADDEGNPARATDAGRAYGGDAWGFGTFPGQYGMALLVDERLTIRSGDIRTFRLLPWDYMPNALMPTDPASEPDDPKPWYAGEAGERYRLSSKSHWDVPVELPNGSVVHFLCSHPTPPAFDGPERRNKLRNHDEIRFWADYLIEAPYIVDDRNHAGGLAAGAHFVILGDLNADPVDGDSVHNPIGRLLLDSPRVQGDTAPASEIEIDGLDATDTSGFGLRVDYVLPSESLTLVRSGVDRSGPSQSGSRPSDHFLVWADLVVPPPAGAPDRP